MKALLASQADNPAPLAFFRKNDMRLAALGILATTSGMGVNNFLSGPMAIQYGALAILGGILCYLLGWTLPSIIGAQRAQRVDFLKALADSDERDAVVQAATRHDFRDALSTMSRSVDHMATTISGAGRSAGQ